MTKEDMLISLEGLEEGVQELQSLLKAAKADEVSRKDIKYLANKVSRKWFEDLEKALPQFKVSEDTIAKYHALFDKLLVLSVKRSSRSTYVSTVNAVAKDFKVDLIIPIMKSSGPIIGFEHLVKILDSVTDPAEKDYLEEAVNCATHGYLRASTVLGWNASIHRVHRTVEKLGLAEFNKKSEEMRAISEGRYKRFNKSFRVNSINELRTTVFDTDLLWVIEYWGLIDGNQHERLQTCFTMRSNCAHPGEAQISPENLASFFSDIKNMILDNPKFKPD